MQQSDTSSQSLSEILMIAASWVWPHPTKFLMLLPCLSLACCLHCYGQTTTDTPDPIRPRKLSVAGLSQYWWERSPGNTWVL